MAIEIDFVIATRRIASLESKGAIEESKLSFSLSLKAFGSGGYKYYLTA